MGNDDGRALIHDLVETFLNLCLGEGIDAGRGFVEDEDGRVLEYDPGYVAPAKEALNMMGLASSKVRRPLPELTKTQRNDLREALLELKLIAK